MNVEAGQSAVASLPTAAPAAADGPKPRSEAELTKVLRGPPQVDLVEHIRTARPHVKSWGALMGEMWRLSRGPGRLTPHEYFYYRLYESRLSEAEKRAFIGKSRQYVFTHVCTDAAWGAVVHDKLLFHGAMTGAGLPVPRLLAVLHKFRAFPNARSLEDAATLVRSLRTDMPYPFFAKPVDGMYSLGAASVTAYEPQADELVLATGERERAQDFSDRVAARPAGYIFQERLRPHPEWADVIGNRISTVRAMVFLRSSGPELWQALCKIPAGANIADNYWRSGNMLGALDPGCGAIVRVVRGVGKGLDVVVEHPDTRRPLPGQRLPLWAQVKELVLEAARTLPGVRLQAWDVALCERGPVLVEVNAGGDFNLPQLAFGKGSLDERLREHLRDCGYKRRV
jgi:hypothetical protein